MTQFFHINCLISLPSSNRWIMTHIFHDQLFNFIPSLQPGNYDSLFSLSTVYFHSLAPTWELWLNFFTINCLISLPSCNRWIMTPFCHDQLFYFTPSLQLVNHDSLFSRSIFKFTHSLPPTDELWLTFFTINCLISLLPSNREIMTHFFPINCLISLPPSNWWIMTPFFHDQLFNFTFSLQPVNYDSHFSRSIV